MPDPGWFPGLVSHVHLRTPELRDAAVGEEAPWALATPFSGAW